MITIYFLLQFDRIQFDAVRRYGKPYRLTLWMKFFLFTLLCDIMIGVGIYHTILQ